jgi:hypothetical protein
MPTPASDPSQYGFGTMVGGSNNTNIDYGSTIDPALTDSNAANFGSAFSSPGSLSSTNLGAPSTTDLSALGSSSFSGSGNPDFGALNDPNYFTSGGQSATGTPYTGITGPQDGTGAPPAAAPTAGAPAAGSGFDWGKLLGNVGQTALGLAPSLIAGGIGLSQAKGAQKQNDAMAAQLSALGGPYTAAGQALLKQFQSGQIRPDQANVANLAATQGQNLIDSAAPEAGIAKTELGAYQAGKIRPDQQATVDLMKASGNTLIGSAAGLSNIAQQAYQDYQAGKLPPADEARLAQQAQAQKQELRQRLSTQGITDSSILAGYDSQIDTQTTMNRQQLLDARLASGNQAYEEWKNATTTGQALQIQGAQFANTSLDQRFQTGNQAYDQWLATTTQGQTLQREGAQFASQSLDTMLSESLGLGQAGMQPIEEAILLRMKSDSAMADQVANLLGNLTSAYTVGKTGGKPGSGAPGTAAAALGTASSALGVAGKAVGGGGAPSTGYTSGLGTGAQAPSNAMDPNYFNAGLQQPIYDSSGLNPVTSDPGSTDPLAALNDPGYFTDTSNIQPIGDPSSPPSAAGGEAAPVGGSGTGTALGAAGGALGVASGLAQGTPTGYAKAGLGATQLAGKAGLVGPGVGAGASSLMGALGIYSGLKQGGVVGDVSAAAGAGQLAGAANAYAVSSATASAAAGGASAADAAAAGAAASSPALQTLGEGASVAAAGLSLYSEVKGWQSGATGSDAMAGASTGAAVGTAVLPGIGTLIGAVLGGVAGAISSVFGSGKKGVAAANWDQLTKTNALKSVAGRDFTTHSWSEAFKGMLDEGNNIFAGGGKDKHKDPDALAKPLEAQVKSGMAKLGPNATTDQVYNQVIVPWMQSSGSGLNWNVLKNEPQQQLMIKSAVDRVLAGEPIVRSEMQAASPATPPGQSFSRALGMGRS